MKTLLHFSAIAFLFIVGVSCSSSDDDLPIPIMTTPTPTLIPSPNPTSTPTPAVTIPDPAPTDVVVTFKANLLPATEIINALPYYSIPIGEATLLFNKTAKTFKITVGADNLNSRYGNIHTADGTVVFVITKDPHREGLTPFSSVINDDQIAELMAHHYYVSMNGFYAIGNSYVFDGDINGQLITITSSGDD